MYLSWIIYALCLALMIVGGRFAGFGKGVHEDFMSLEATRSMRGLAALGVLLHFISREPIFADNGELRFFLHSGPFFAAVFFFCSGYGLIVSMEKKPNYLNYFGKKRLISAVIPFYVNTIILFTLMLIMGESLSTVNIITNLTGVSPVNPCAWFPIVIFILYLVYFIVFRHVENRTGRMLWIIATVVAMGLIFCANGYTLRWLGGNSELKNFTRETIPWWRKESVFWFSGEWWVNATFAFPMGMIVASHEDQILCFFKRGYWFKLAAALVLFVGTHHADNFMQKNFGYYINASGEYSKLPDRILTLLVQYAEVSAFVISLYIVLMKFYSVNKVSSFLGKIAYETYLINVLPLTLLRFITEDGNTKNYTGKLNFGMIQYVAGVIALSIFLGWLLNTFDNFLINRISQIESKPLKAPQRFTH